MTRRAVLTAVLSDFLLLLFCVLGALLCPLTALNLPYERGTLLAGCCLLCLLTALWNQFIRYQWPLLLAGAAGIALAVQTLRPELETTVLQLASAALDAWRTTYSWIGSFSWEPAGTADAQTATILYLLLAAALVLLPGRMAIRQSVSTAFLLTLPALILSLIGEDAAPAPLALFLLLAFWLGMLLTRDLRKNRDLRSQAAALCLPCLSLALLAGLYYICGPDSYIRPSEANDVQLAVTTAMEDLSEMTLSDFTGADSDSAAGQSDEVHLDELDGGPTSTATVLRVKASWTGTLYLRGTSMLDYADNTWSIGSAGEDYETYFAALTDAEAEGTVEIRAVQDSSGLLYTVYGLCGELPDGAVLLGDYAISREENSWTLEVSSQYRNTASTVYAAAIWNDEDCLEIGVNSVRMQALQDLALEATAGLSGTVTVDEVADAVAAYVRNSGVYDLDTPANPEGTDFVLYFLQESHQGYCVHFASAAALLLRTLGIPARYVTGYAVTITEADAWTDVTAADAHAWVEYFNGSVWVPLEATPGLSGTTLPDEAAGTQSDSESAENAESTESAETGSPDSRGEAQEAEPAAPASEPAASEPEAEAGSSRAVRAVVLCLLSLAAAAALLLLRRQLILFLRRRKFRNENPGQAFVAMWTWLLKLEKCGIVPDKPMISLAEKARFSREGATAEDCQALESWIDAKIRALYRQAGWPKKLLLRYWYVLQPVQTGRKMQIRKTQTR